MSAQNTSIRAHLARIWPYVAMYGGLFLVLGFLLFAGLGSLLPGYSANEAQAFEASNSLRNIFDNPVNAPFALAVHGLSYIGEHGYMLTRIVAASVGFVTLVLFCWLLRQWYGIRTAVFGTVLFGTTAWFLHAARLGTPDVLLFILLALIACGVWLKRTNNPFVLLLCFILAGLALYVPGMIWLVAFVAFWEWRQIDFIFKRHLWAVALGVLLLLGAAAPLVRAIYHTPEIAKTLAGLPAEGWPTVLSILQGLLEVPLALFARAPLNPEMWLGHLPLLDAFATAMFILGAYLYLRHARLARAKLFVPVIVVSWALIALGGSVSYSILLPFIYIVVAAGAGFMVDSWLRIFPRNPIARGIGIGLVGLAVLAACSFQLRHYFIAWPNNPEVRAIYTLQKPSATIDE